MILRLRRQGHALTLWGEADGRPLPDDALAARLRFLFRGWRAPVLEGRGVLHALQGLDAGLESPLVTLSPEVREAVAVWRCVARLVAAGRVAPVYDAAGEARWGATLLPEGRDPALVHALTDLWMRTCASTTLTRAQAAKARFLTADDAWLAALRAPSAAVAPADPALADALRVWSAPLFEGGRAALPIRPLHGEDGWRLDLPGLEAWRRGDAPEPPVAALRLLGQAVAVAPFLALPQPWDAATLARFLREGVPALRAAAFRVDLPPALEPTVPALRETAVGMVGEQVRVERTVLLGGIEIPEAEARAILDAGEPLALVQGEWRYVDLDALRRALDALGPALLPKRGALPLLLAGALRVAPGAQAVQDFLREMTLPPAGDLPLRGVLRPYQAQGVCWLMQAAAHGLGVCLADDMGLGKTLQTIAFLLTRPAPALVVAPLTVLPVWERELARWAPRLRVLRHIGPDRPLRDAFPRRAGQVDVVLTAYGYLWRDYPSLRRVRWQTLVLDEAQLIKNPTTRQSQAARSLPAAHRLALTGTPIENRLDDLWSILDFLNPDLFGPRRDFAERYADPERLRRAVSHFLLRRLKTDPALLPDLPPRITQEHYAPLTDAQAAAYDLALAQHARADDDRHGAVLALLTRLKLICDGSGDGLEDAPSGKLLTLLPLLDDILARGESALLFTQYARVGAALRATLSERLGRPVPFLHGALTPTQRRAQVAAFTDDPRPGLLILSLRAGAFGLTLTKASHVIHYDRWWNPAVENQATDRAHRIGQTRTVVAHHLICKGTLEERIDRLLRHKRLLADRIVAPTPAALLAKLPTDTLLSLLRRE